MNKEFFAMDTYNIITVFDDIPESVLDSAERKLRELERLWSVTDRESEIYELNHANGKPVTVSDDTAQLVQFSIDMGEKTGGVLDITLYPVLTAWGFTAGNQQIPSDDVLKERMMLTGIEKINLFEHKLSIQPEMQIDLGAVAKGYASDLLTQMLKEQGVSSGIVSLGGNIQAIGSKPDGSDFNISVEHPIDRDSLGIISLSDSCVVTSGAYERYFEGEDGEVYGHILDPKTGRPANTDLDSVTVIGKEGKLCDALSTALFVMGLDDAVDYWRMVMKDTCGRFGSNENHGEFDMILVTKDGDVWITENLTDNFRLSESHADIKVNEIRK